MKRKTKKVSGLRRLLLTGAFLGASIVSGLGLYNTNNAHADDVTTTQDISFVTAVDSDGDGLRNSVETNTGTFVDLTNTGTDPNNADTDGDGFGDGVESVNYLGALDGNPLNSDNPGPGDAFSDYGNTQNITSGTTANAISPTWLLRGRMAYVEAESPGFGNGTLFVKNLGDLSKSRIELETGLSAELREIDAGPLGGLIYFHKDDGTGKDAIYKVGRGGLGNPNRAVPGPFQSLLCGIENPSIFANLKINKGLGEIEFHAEKGYFQKSTHLLL